MSVELFRIDDRLIHGQVVVGWGKPLDAEFIVLVDDEVAASDWEQDLYRMGVPPEMEVYFDSIDSAVERLPDYLADTRRGILLTGDIAIMRALAERSGRVESVNVGGLHHRPGRIERLRYVFLAPEEEAELRALESGGVEVTAQDLSERGPDVVVRGAREPGTGMSVMDVAPFVLLGGVLGLDVVSFPQAMVSRPLVAATVAGAFAGDAERGLLLGVVLELVALGTLPFGASRYPEWGSASVVGGALYGGGVSAAPGQLALAVLATLLAAWLSSGSMVWLRKLNARWVRRSRAELDAGNGDRVVALQLRGLGADLVRGALVTAVGLALLAPLYAALAQQWSRGAAEERALMVGLTAALGAGTIWMLVRGTAGTRALIIAGLVVGVVMVL